MKIVALLLCALGLVAVPACKKNEEGKCGSCHHEKRKHHDCKEKRCSFFGRCVEGEEREEGEDGKAKHRRYDDAK